MNSQTNGLASPLQQAARAVVTRVINDCGRGHSHEFATTLFYCYCSRAPHQPSYDNARHFIPMLFPIPKVISRNPRRGLVEYCAPTKKR